MPNVVALLAPLLIGCVASSPKPQQHVDTIIRAAPTSQPSLDTLAGIRFPEQHGNFTRRESQQVSESQFKVLYTDEDSGVILTYTLLDIINSDLTVLEENINNYVEKFFENLETVKINNYRNYSEFSFVSKQDKFIVLANKNSLKGKWKIIRYSKINNLNKYTIEHNIVTAYRKMILYIVIIYTDHITQQVRDGSRESPPLDTLLDIHKAFAREMLEPTRTFLQ